MENQKLGHTGVRETSQGEARTIKTALLGEPVWQYDPTWSLGSLNAYRHAN